MTAREAIGLLIRYLLCAVGAVTLFFILFSFPVRTDYGLISANTGSRHEYSQWLGFLRTNERYIESPIEAYLHESERQLDDRWVSYAGTGRNIFGMAVIRSHGSPGAVLDFSPHLFDYARTLTPEVKGDIARELSSGDERKIIDRMAKLSIEYYGTLTNE